MSWLSLGASVLVGTAIVYIHESDMTMTSFFKKACIASVAIFGTLTIIDKVFSSSMLHQNQTINQGKIWDRDLNKQQEFRELLTRKGCIKYPSLCFIDYS